MKKQILEWVTHIKERSDTCADIALMLDDMLYEIPWKVYNEKNVMDVLYVLFHVVGNYTLWSMFEQWCSKEFIEKRHVELANELHLLIKEYVKINTKTFYK